MTEKNINLKNMQENDLKDQKVMSQKTVELAL